MSGSFAAKVPPSEGTSWLPGHPGYEENADRSGRARRARMDQRRPVETGRDETGRDETQPGEASFSTAWSRTYGEPMIGRIDEVVVDCADPMSLAGFWAGVLGGEPVRR